MWFQGGDGFFNEILNGLLSSRHKAPYPPAPTEFMQSVGNIDSSPAKKRFRSISSHNDGGEFFHDPNDTATETSHQDDSEPLLPNSESIALGLSSFSMYHKLFFYNPTPALLWCPNVKGGSLICWSICLGWQEQELSCTAQVSLHMNLGDWFNSL